jgi:hypothetical protein
MTTQLPPAGWYPHPSGMPGRLYWDGRGWDDAAPATTGPAAARTSWDKVRRFWSGLSRERRVMCAIAGLLVLVSLPAVQVVGVRYLLGEGSLPFRTPSVAKSDLRNDIIHRLHATMNDPDSVTCTADLPGVVGKTTSCEVANSATGGFEAIATVKKVDGATISYDVTPALSKEQLEQQVKAQNRESVMGVGGPINAVTCESGLEGKKGNEAHCQFYRDGTKQLTATVTDVDGLQMNVEFNIGPS